MKHLVIGIVAHVDAGKTTLSEAMLYLSGKLRRLGRVDHGDSFLDTDGMEKKRGITIFSKQAVFTVGDTEFTLLDTPGHVDFSAETERVLQVLDGAVLVVSAGEGVQAHTKTLWKLLAGLHIPTFLFVNKTDLYGVCREKEEAEFRREFGAGCVFVENNPSLAEQLAECDETLMEAYFDGKPQTHDMIAQAVGQRRIFPCYEGSALKAEGVSSLLTGIGAYLPSPPEPREFGARIFKITRDASGKRLTWMKITGGRLMAKDHVRCSVRGWDEKADEIRVYNGDKYTPSPAVYCGAVCAVTGLSQSEAGDGVGFEKEALRTVLEPVMIYGVLPEDGTDIHLLYRQLKILAEEDPKFSPVWDAGTEQIHISLMGEVQQQILVNLIQERFGVRIRFDEGTILLKETVASTTCGAGHYEPLRHYAEVHLRIEPGEPGSGLRFRSACSPDVLSGNWQRLILHELSSELLTGVLTDSPLTDMVITLTAGRAHPKHTEGGDFRQAALRALRQGLLKGESVLLEPYCSFTVTVPAEYTGKVMTDLRLRAGESSVGEPEEGKSVLTGEAPVSEMRDYPRTLASITRGQGRISYGESVYKPCHNAEDMIAARGYDGQNDPYHPADSVFCQNGAGRLIKWNEADALMHILPEDDKRAEVSCVSNPGKSGVAGASAGSFADAARLDAMILSIFERTYGKIRPRTVSEKTYNRSAATRDMKYVSPATPAGTLPECILVDGYNLLFQWDALNQTAGSDLSLARDILIRMLSEYQAYRRCTLFLIFDAYRVPGREREKEETNGFSVIFTKEDETADTYIEKTVHTLCGRYRVRVVTSDSQVQNIAFGSGALRVSIREFRQELETVTDEIRRTIRELADDNARAEQRVWAERAAGKPGDADVHEK